MLKDSNMMESYIKKGKSEIHWEGEKLNHFELIKKLKYEYPEEVNQIIEMIKSNYSEPKIIEIVNDIDSELPEELNHYKLPGNRKELIIKLITLRVQNLIEIKN